MRYTIPVILALVLISNPISLAEKDSKSKPAAIEDGIELYFSPNGGAANAVIHELEQARKSVVIACYSFSSSRIAKALLDAKKRGVEVTVILDPGQASQDYSSSKFFTNQGVTTYVAKVGYRVSYHHKVMLIDGNTIITGSMNFTRAGDESNTENMLIMRDRPKLYAAYSDSIAKDIKTAKKLPPTNGDDEPKDD